MKRSQRTGLPDELPMRRVAAFWNWLPAFRAVAETEHLRRAARFLALSPPALSRSIKQLEDGLGRPLFSREGRRLQLTEQGRGLLVVVRRAMRAVDDATRNDAGPFRIYAPPSLAPLVAEAWRHLPQGLVLRSQALGTGPNSALLRGAVDLVVAPSAMMTSHKELTVTDVGTLRWAVFGGESGGSGGETPLSDGPPPAVAVAGWDGWPVERDRTVVMEVEDVATALAMAKTGLSVALPVRVAPAGLARRGPTWKVGVVAVQRAVHDSAPPHDPASGKEPNAEVFGAVIRGLTRVFAATSRARSG